jgi:uncharacterized protein YpiB (UPF0302 family)
MEETSNLPLLANTVRRIIITLDEERRRARDNYIAVLDTNNPYIKEYKMVADNAMQDHEEMAQAYEKWEILSQPGPRFR